MNTRPHAIVIGAGFTGCATAHDLSLRGFDVTVIERGDITNGTSGRTHGLLHSGARYCVTDPEAAVECIQENIVLRQITQNCIEVNGGLFVALTEGEMNYAPAFELGAQACGIPIEKLTNREVLAREPYLNPAVLVGYIVPDAVFDPLRLALAFAASARKNGAVFRTYTETNRLIIDGLGRVSGVGCMDRHSGRSAEYYADIVINATGVWAGEITGMAGVHVPIIPTPGVMVAFDQRLCQAVINRLAEPGDGDIIIPQRRMCVIGTTSYETNEVDYITVEGDQVAEMQYQACRLIPELANTRQRGAWMSARPLIGTELAGRSLSRTFKCYDHEELDGLPGLITITGGKATTCRAMAEATADVACNRLGVTRKIDTRLVKLESYRDYYRQ